MFSNVYIAISKSTSISEHPDTTVVPPTFTPSVDISFSLLLTIVVGPTLLGEDEMVEAAMGVLDDDDCDIGDNIEDVSLALFLLML